MQRCILGTTCVIVAAVPLRWHCFSHRTHNSVKLCGRFQL